MLGRPPKYKPIYCKMLVEHMAEGLSYETFAAKVGVCRDTLYDWEKVYPDFLYTKRQAMEISQLWWEKAGINGLYTITEIGEGNQRTVIEKKINQAIWIFNMKARFHWKDEGKKLELPPPQERQVLTLEAKKQLLLEAKKEIEVLEQEIQKEQTIDE